MAQIGSVDILDTMTLNRVTIESGGEHLAKLQRLNKFEFSSAPLPNILDALCTLANLRELRLNYTDATDKDLQTIACLRLKILDISNNPAITDEGLEHLRSMQTLRSLHLDGTRVTLEGVMRLKGALPDLEAYYQPALRYR
jgi:hypothetical protein